MSATDEIKARLDIINYIQQFVPLKKSGRYFKACCPFHSEKTPSFVVNADSQSWRCFGSCAEGGDILSFAMKYHGWSFTEALKELGTLAGVEVEQQTPEQREKADYHDTLRGMLQSAADFYHEQLLQTPAVLAYARDRRGFTLETIQAYGIGYAPEGWSHTIDFLKQMDYNEDMLLEVGLVRRNDAGRTYDYFRNRLVIPIRDERGRVIGFGARALSDEDQPKYLNSPQTALFDKSRTLFGLDMAKRAIRDAETAVIVEGYMDVIQAHQAGFLNVVAQMGTAMTEHQLKLLVPRYAHKIILALDSDAAGQNATMRSLEVARQALQADYTGKLAVDMRVLNIPGAKDPDDLIREDPQSWQTVVANAVPVADYVMNAEMSALPPNATLQEREAVARRLLPILQASENKLYRQDNLQKLAMKLRIGERDLLNWSYEQTRINQARPPRRSDPPPPPPPAAYDEPPDLPPLDYDDSLIPLDDPDGSEIYHAPTAPSVQPVLPPRFRSATAHCEAECLGVLLQQPDLLFQVNRKFRELAGGDNDLLAGALIEFCEDDFSQGEYRQLMTIFQQALTQDDIEPLAYLQRNVDHGLLQQVNTILAGVLEQLRPRLRHGLSADLAVVMKQAAPVDFKSILIKNALYLRAQRLQREREDLYFLLTEAQNGDDSDIKRQISLSIRAKRLIDAELQSQAKNLY